MRFLLAALALVGCSGGEGGRALGGASDGGRLVDASPLDAPSPGSEAASPDMDGTASAAFDASTLVQREVPGFVDRPYLVHLPAGTGDEGGIPLVLVLHGGGGTATGTRRLTCPAGILVSPRCLEAVGDRKGFAVIYPNGTPGVGAQTGRTWNAGGGANGFQCVSGAACLGHVDDVGYFRALLDDLETWMRVDTHRVYATGISNGAAMCHRLACELSDRISSIAPVAGGNQLSTTQACSPGRPVSDLEIHGTEDPCWAYAGGPDACLQKDGLDKISVAETVLGWVARDGCTTTPDTTALPDTDPNDGTTTQAIRYAPCNANAEVLHLEIVGGGHTWPGGFQYLPLSTVGRVAKDFDANPAIWEFFAAHPMP